MNALDIHKCKNRVMYFGGNSISYKALGMSRFEVRGNRLKKRNE